MDPAEREHMLELPDRSPASRGEVERRQAIERSLESLSPMRAPDGLWSDICRRIEAEPVQPARRDVASRFAGWRRPVTGVAAALFLAVTTWFVVSEIDPFGTTGGDPGGPGNGMSSIDWIIVDGDAFDRSLSAEDPLFPTYRSAIEGPAWGDSPASLYPTLLQSSTTGEPR